MRFLYSAWCPFFIENCLDYLETSLRAFTDKHAIQQVLIEICSTRVFNRTIDVDKITAIYRLFRMHRDCFFYLNALYYALQHITQRNCLKILMMDELERSTTAKNEWVVSSMSNGILRQRKRYKRCDGYKCIGPSCNYCRLVGKVEFGDLLAALRYAQSKQ